MTMLIPLLGLMFVGLLLWVWGTRLRRATGLPSGRVVSIDLGGLTPVENVLYDRAWGLAGRPDYVLEDHGLIIPVEVKSSAGPEAPYAGHRIQLAAYCHLIESTYGRRPTYGILRYAGRSFMVDYDRALEVELRKEIDEIRAGRDRAPGRSHAQPERCRACGYSSGCDASLV